VTTASKLQIDPLYYPFPFNCTLVSDFRQAPARSITCKTICEMRKLNITDLKKCIDL